MFYFYWHLPLSWWWQNTRIHSVSIPIEKNGTMFCCFLFLFKFALWFEWYIQRPGGSLALFFWNIMTTSNHVVIMAGGIGSRFWPMSTIDCPKQFIDVLGCGKSLLQLTVDRFAGICPLENIWVLTSEKYAPLVKEQLPMILEENILKEL